MTTPNTNSVAFKSAQLMSDYRKTEEILQKVLKENRNYPTESEKIFLRGALDRLPADKRVALEPIFNKLLEM